MDSNVIATEYKYISVQYVHARKKEIDTIPFVLLGLRLEQVVVGALGLRLPSSRVARVYRQSFSLCSYQVFLVL